MNEPHLASAEFGGFWIRFLALVADSAIVFLFMVLIVAGGATYLGEDLLPVAVLAACLFALLYWPVMQASWLQATFGKALLGLRITGYQGNRIFFRRSLGRELSKILSSAMFMLGYVLAAFTARKQSLHDLLASTYVVRAGKARIVSALVVAAAGFVLPVVAVPMVVDPALMNSMTAMVKAIDMPKAPPAVVAAAPKPPPAPPPVVKPAPPPPPAPEVAKPVPVAEKPPEPVPTAAAPVIAQVAPAPAIEQQKAEPAKAAPKKAVARKAAPRPSRPTAVANAPAAFEPKRASSPRFNDLMTAVLYRDAEAVRELLRFGRWPDKPDSRGTTPLMLAVGQGDAGSAEALLKAGADASLAIPVAQARRDAAMLELLKRYAAR